MLKQLTYITYRNVSYFFNQNADILVKNDRQWIHIEDVEIDDALFRVVYDAEGVKVSLLKIKRENRSGLQRIWEFLLPPKIMVFEFSPQ